MNNKFFNSKLWYMLPIVGAIIVSVPIFFWKEFSEHQKNNKEQELLNYPILVDIKKGMKGVVINKKGSSAYMGTFLYILSDNNKFSLANQEVDC